MTESRGDDVADLGRSIPTGPLLAWATEQITSAKGKEHSLQRHGIDTSHLAEIRNLIAMIGGVQDHLEKEASEPTKKLDFVAASESQTTFDESIRSQSRIFRIVALIREHSTLAVKAGSASYSGHHGKSLNEGPELTKLQVARDNLDGSASAFGVGP